MEDEECLKVQVNPQLQDQEMKEGRFITGTQVEVRLPDEHCTGAWFPATILKEIDTDFFLVEYKSLSLSGVGVGESLKDVLDIQHIRCLPPRNEDKKEFVSSEEVDAFFDHGWWTGVVREVLSGDRYIVSFEHQTEQWVFNSSELRLHMECEDGMWVERSQKEIQQAAGLGKEATDMRVLEQSNKMVSQASQQGSSDFLSVHGSGFTPCSTPTNKKQSSPFVKTFPLWKSVDSMEVFISQPQSPHFKPLEQEYDVLREGLAVGYMLSYGLLAEKTRKTRIDEPKSSFETKLESLTSIEAMGIEVEQVRARLQVLIQEKETKETLEENLKEVEEEIMKEKSKVECLENEEDEIDENLRKIEETLSELERMRRRLVVKKETTATSVCASQETHEGLKRKREIRCSEFLCVAKEPL